MTDQLTARELMEQFFDTVRVSQMDDLSYQDALLLISSAPQDEPFTVRNKADKHLIQYCLNYTAPIVEDQTAPIVSFFNSVMSHFKVR